MSVLVQQTVIRWLTVCGRAVNASPEQMPSPTQHQTADRTNTSLSHLPDELLLRILMLAHQGQIVAITADPVVTYSLPPCLSTYLQVSKRLARLAKHVPIRLLHVHSVRGPQMPERTVRLLCSIRCPVQIMDFSEALSGDADWTAISVFLSNLPQSEQVQTIRIICITKRDRHEGPITQCRPLQNLINIVKLQMPQCKVQVNPRRE